MLILTDQKGERQVTVKDLEKIFDISLKSLEKNRIFELNPSFNGLDLGASSTSRGAIYRTPRGITRPSVFTFKYEGYDCSLRYCTQVPHKKSSKDGVVNVYTPRNIRIPGKRTPAENLDAAVFLYLSTMNKQSPFRGEGNWMWNHFDPEVQANQEIEVVDILFEALSHAKEMKTDDMVVFCKGLGMNVDGLSSKEIRSKLLLYAKSNPKEYVASTEKNLVKYLGMVQDAIDNKIFVVKDTGGFRYWTWAKGAYKDVNITAIPAGSTSDSDVLKDFVKDPKNLGVYYAEIKKQRHETMVDSDSESMLKDLMSEEPAENIKPIDSDKYIPDTFAAAKEYLTNLHEEKRSPSQSATSAFMKSIESGEINYENIDEKALDYINKS